MCRRHSAVLPLCLTAERMKTAENERDQARADVQKVTDEAEAERARHNALVAQMAHKAADLKAKLKASQAAASAASAEAERLRKEAQQAAADRTAALEQQVADLEADLTTCEAAAFVARSEAQQRLQEAQQAAAERMAALEQVARLEAELAASEQTQDARTQTPSSKEFSVWNDDEEIEQPMHAAASEIVVYRLGEWPVPMDGGITAYNQFNYNFGSLVLSFAALLYGEGNVEGHIAQTQREHIVRCMGLGFTHAAWPCVLTATCTHSCFV